MSPVWAAHSWAPSPPFCLTFGPTKDRWQSLVIQVTSGLIFSDLKPQKLQEKHESVYVVKAKKKKITAKANFRRKSIQYLTFYKAEGMDVTRHLSASGQVTEGPEI